MKLHPIAIAVLIAAPFALRAPAHAQHVTAIDNARSEIRFVSKQMNVPVEGQFRRFTAQVDFDAQRLASSRAQVDVELGSIDIGSSEAETEAKGKAWFNLPQFPTATFRSTGLKALGGSKYEATGKLSIKGRTLDITAPFTVTQVGGATVFEGGFTLFRLQFALGEGVWSDTETVANEVRVRFKLTGTSRKETPRPSR